MTPVEVQTQIDETEADLQAFIEARDVIRRRVVEVRDRPTTALLPRIHDWTGTVTVLGALDLSIHAMERTLEELKQIHKALSHGQKFRVIDGENHGEQD